MLLNDQGIGLASAGPTLVDLFLREQQRLPAVDRFTREIDRVGLPDQSRYYSTLLPASPPGPGQQYAFEVDLDRCSGCKGCVVACHSLNGLDELETWRDVGLLIGGSELAPVMQHVTTACHHCLEPACLNACPVNAYEKDARTGIVKHLDDQCFGCQYCTLACPYDVPKYHAKKGIVRKCDMCSNRLSQREAPACVQACPHSAIAIRVVDVSRVMENAEVDDFLPGAPEPHLTLPTTTYKTNRVFPRNMLPVDYHSINAQHPHWPLIVMLVLTQLSVGAFTVGCWLDSSLDAGSAALLRPYQATCALLLGLLALGASTCHLGRPQYAFRGILGLRHSWLSREILAFGLFSGLAVPYAAVCWLSSRPSGLTVPGATTLIAALPALGMGVAGVGIAGVFCSVMIYVFTKRELWNIERTLVRFGLTTAVLGIATTWLSLMILGVVVHDPATSQLTHELTPVLARALLVASALKLAVDLTLLRHLANFRHTPLKRSALLVAGVLWRYGAVRLVAGTVGGVFIPLWILDEVSRTGSLPGGWFSIVATLIVWAGCLVGELLERYLFFAAVSAPRMPGGVRP